LGVAGGPLILKQIVVAGGKKGGGVVVVTFAGTEEEGGGGTCDLADALGLRFVEPWTDEVTAICCGIGTGGSAGDRRWGGGWVFEVEKRRGERTNSISKTGRRSFDNIHVMAAIGVYGRTKVESTSGMGSPRGTCERGFKYIAQFPGRANGMGIKIERKTMKAVVGRECGIGVPRLEVV
jgi:hypothetical protein